MLKETRERYQLNIKIMVDLHGIKNSVGKLSKPLKVILGNTLYLDTTTSIGFNNTIPFKNYDLLDRLVEGDMLFLTQGHVKMRVVDTLGNGCLQTVVSQGGVISSGMDIKFSKERINKHIIMSIDRFDIKSFCLLNEITRIDYISLPSVESTDELIELKNNIPAYSINIIAKIERKIAV